MREERLELSPLSGLDPKSSEGREQMPFFTAFSMLPRILLEQALEQR
jgi:hypothetical protein